MYDEKEVWMKTCARSLCLALTLGALAAPSLATASPWTLPQHELVVSTDLTFSFATQEYLDDGEKQAYALDGRFNSTSLSVSTRYGLTDKLELEVRPTFKHVSYEADSVILDCVPMLLDCDGQYDLEEARANVIDFDDSLVGPADLDAAIRYNLYRSYIVATTEVGTKIPMAYRKPSGTFSDVTALEVGDDVTLGDGQIDAHVGLLLGAYIPWTRSFLRTDAFYNHRFAEPGNQVLLNGKAGQFLTQNLIAFGGVRWAKTITEGESIGTSFVDTDPENNPASAYKFEKVEARELSLDRDFLTLEAGVILKVNTFEFQLRFEEVLTARNYGDLTSVSLGVIANIPSTTFFTPPEPVEAQEGEGEFIEEVIIEEVPAGEAGEGEEVIIEEVIIEVPVEESPPEPTPLPAPTPPSAPE